MIARKQGDTLVLSIPAKLNVEEGTEYMAMKGMDGSLIFTPKGPNIFTSKQIEKNSFRSEWDDFSESRVGREEI